MTTSAVLTISQVIDRMEQLQQSLPAADGVAVFNRMYLDVTRQVQEKVTAGYFADPAGLALLDGLFAGRYLAAVDADRAGQPVTACWRPLFELRDRPGIHPLQYALAGMNAHIEHDLPMSVLDTCERLGRTPEEVSADYHRVNDLLAQVEGQVRAELLPDPAALKPADPLLHILGVWSVDTAREAAWASVLTLWELRDSHLACDAMTSALSGSVGMVSRALLTPLDA